MPTPLRALVGAVAGLLAIALVSAPASASVAPRAVPASAPTQCGVLFAGQELLRGQTLVSCDGESRLVHQGDGNVVLYINGNDAFWATNTAGSDTRTFVMQGDGNLVLYTTSNQPIWDSGTPGNNGATAQLLGWPSPQTDPDLFLYVVRANGDVLRIYPCVPGVRC